MSKLQETIYKALKEPLIMSLATVTEDGKPWVRYITGWASEDMAIRFVTSMKSRKVAHIKRNSEVHLTCGATSMDFPQTYFQISGKAKITTDKEERDRFWNDELKQHFQGPDDPTFCICIVKPYRIEYYGMTETKPEIWEPKKT